MGYSTDISRRNYPGEMGADYVDIPHAEMESLVLGQIDAQITQTENPPKRV